MFNTSTNVFINIDITIIAKYIPLRLKQHLLNMPQTYSLNVFTANES